MHIHRAMRIVLIILSSLILAFIWLNSFLPAEISQKISNMAQKILGIESTQYAVRKAGHFTEFLFLGLFLSLLVNTVVKRIKDRFFCLSFFAIFVPLMDETIQLFSPGRSAEVKDIWIDIGGSLVGCAVAIVLLLISAFISSRRLKIKTTKDRMKYGE